MSSEEADDETMPEPSDPGLEKEEMPAELWRREELARLSALIRAEADCSADAVRRKYENNDFEGVIKCLADRVTMLEIERLMLAEARQQVWDKEGITLHEQFGGSRRRANREQISRHFEQQDRIEAAKRETAARMAQEDVAQGRVPCIKCGAMLLPETAARTGGICKLCQQGLRY